MCPLGAYIRTVNGELKIFGDYTQVFRRSDERKYNYRSGVHPCHKRGLTRRKTTLIAPLELLELVTPFADPLRRVDERGKLGRRPWLRHPAERDDGAQRAPLQLARALEVLLDGVLRDRRALHALLQRGRDVVQPLRDRRRRDLGEAEQHHVADDLHFVRIVRQTNQDVAQELVQVEFIQTRVELYTLYVPLSFPTFTGHTRLHVEGTYQSVQGLIHCLAGLKAVIDFVCPRAHLYGPNQLWLHDRLLIETRQYRR